MFKKIFKSKICIALVFFCVFVLQFAHSCYAIEFVTEGSSKYNNDDYYSPQPESIIKMIYDNYSLYFTKILSNNDIKNSTYYDELLTYIYNKQYMFIDNVDNSTWRVYYVNRTPKSVFGW